MPNPANPVALLALALCACTQSADPPAVAEAPEPIGDQLLQVEGTWAVEACASSRLYRDGDRIQHQCFDASGDFSWENRGNLTQAAAEALDMELASADLEATEPVNYEGGCGAADSQGSVSIWVEDEQVDFELDCLFEGIAPLYEQIDAVAFEIESCTEPFSYLASVEPDCRAY